MHAINQKSGVGRFFTYLIEYSISSIYISLMTTDITMQYPPMLYSDHSCVAMTIFELSIVDFWQCGFYRAYEKSRVTQEGVEAPASTGAEPEMLPSQGPIQSPDFGALQRSSLSTLTKGPSDHPFRPHFNVPLMNTCNSVPDAFFLDILHGRALLFQK